MTGKMPVTLSVNGETHELFISPARRLLDVLREDLRLTGAKNACNQGVCGSCTVLIDGATARACLCLAVSVVGRSVTTIEGLATGDTLTDVQQAFLDAGAIQCGFCMPGMIISATELLDTNPVPTDDEIRTGISGNLCRCSGYVKVIDAIRLAARRRMIAQRAAQ